MYPLSSSPLTADGPISNAVRDLREISFFSFKIVISFLWTGALESESSFINSPLEVISIYLLCLKLASFPFLKDGGKK